MKPEIPYNEMMSNLKILAKKDTYVAQAVRVIEEQDQRINKLLDVIEGIQEKAA